MQIRDFIEEIKTKLNEFFFFCQKRNSSCDKEKI